MAWIPSHQELGQHPKTKKLARLLDISLPTAVGHLHYLWWWALNYAQDGTLEKYDGYDLADAMQWAGDPDQLVEALISAGYIDDTDEGLALHDWGEYGGKLLEQKMKDRERKRTPSTSARTPKKLRDNSDGTPAETAKKPSVDKKRKEEIRGDESTEEQTTQHTEAQALQERRFTEFWKAYPKKVGKASCLKAWKKLKPTAELHDHIMAALEAQKHTDQWQRESGRFIPNPLTWLNQGRWDDEPTETTNAGPEKFDTMAVLKEIMAEGGDGE